LLLLAEAIATAAAAAAATSPPTTVATARLSVRLWCSRSEVTFATAGLRTIAVLIAVAEPTTLRAPLLVMLLLLLLLLLLGFVLLMLLASLTTAAAHPIDPPSTIGVGHTASETAVAAWSERSSTMQTCTATAATTTATVAAPNHGWCVRELALLGWSSKFGDGCFVLPATRGRELYRARLACHLHRRNCNGERSAVTC
jgi:hypothetical protein